MATDTWYSRDLPVLEAVLGLEETDAKQVQSSQLAKLAGVSDAEARRSWGALSEDGYVTCSQILGGNYGQWVLVHARLRGKGRRALGQWPEDGIDALLTLLDERIQAETEPAARSKLEGLRDAARGVSREVLGELIADLIRGIRI